MSYKYEDLTKNGYKQFYLTKKEHNGLFPRRKRTWKYRFEYYISENNIILYRFLSIWVKTLQIIGFPINIIYAGMSGFKELLKEYRRMFFEKKCGSFTSDEIYKSSELYTIIKNKLNNLE
jgi:hypothetical protein